MARKVWTTGSLAARYGLTGEVFRRLLDYDGRLSALTVRAGPYRVLLDEDIPVLEEVLKAVGLLNGKKKRPVAQAV